METKNRPLRVKEGRTELTADHNGNDLTFIHPAFGPGTYADIKNKIKEAKLNKPTLAQTVSLVHTAFNSNDK